MKRRCELLIIIRHGDISAIIAIIPQILRMTLAEKAMGVIGIKAYRQRARTEKDGTRALEIESITKSCNSPERDMMKSLSENLDKSKRTFMGFVPNKDMFTPENNAKIIVHPIPAKSLI
jgi:hypothetical protein